VKLPRDVSGSELASALQTLGYQTTHQTGSHLRLTTTRNGEHHVTVPAHNPLKVGTLAAILRSLGEHHGMDRESLLRMLFD